MQSLMAPTRTLRRIECRFLLRTGVWAAGILLSSISLVPAEDFRLRYLDAEPISLHVTLSYEGKGERLTATAKNESSTTLRHAKICILSVDLQKECLFQLWNSDPWTPATELHWDLTSNRKVRTLGYTVSLTELEVSGVSGGSILPSPSPEIPSKPQVAPTNSPSPVPVPRGAKPRDWRRGTLLDSVSTKTYRQTGTTTTQTNAPHNSIVINNNAGGLNTAPPPDFSSAAPSVTTTQINGITLKETQFLIVGSDYLFVVSDNTTSSVGSAVAFGALGMKGVGRRPCPLAVNDPVTYARERDVLYVLDLDGKECKMAIIRQERIIPVTPAATP